MDAQTLRASLVAQRDAAFWYAQQQRWRDQADVSEYDFDRNAAYWFAAEDQAIAAQLSLADRTFRGLEG